MLGCDFRLVGQGYKKDSSVIILEITLESTLVLGLIQINKILTCTLTLNMDPGLTPLVTQN